MLKLIFVLTAYACKVSDPNTPIQRNSLREIPGSSVETNPTKTQPTII